MTAQDPRLDEIQARLDAATPGPWAFDGTEIDTVPDPEGDTPWKSIMECRVDCMSYCYGGSIAMDIGSDDRALIQSAPADIAYLLAELRKAHEALARVESDAAVEDAAKAIHNAGDWDIPWTGDDWRADCARLEARKALRAAVAAAKGDERG